MTTINIVSYSSDQRAYRIAEFDEILRHSLLCYSMRHLILVGITSHDEFKETLERSMVICNYAGINIAHHYKRIFVFDSESGTTSTDWLMSKKGFKLIIMQYAQINAQNARWLWELADQ